jgi:DNA-binding beta-propeller fold protein YncE
MKRQTLVTTLALAVIGIASYAAAALMTLNTPAPDAPTPAPQFEVDPAWPKPLPNRWLMGQAAGVAVDRHDHIWVVQRPKSLTEDERGATLTPPRSMCCAPAPPVLEFDIEGNLLQSWGGPGPGYGWPENEHGIYVDEQDNVWLAGNGPKDGQILKFTRAGRHLLTIGAPGVIGNDADTSHLNRPANVVLDPQTNELFVADGYGNHRVIVFDAQTGAYKRHWGANGRPPGDASVKGFGNPVHCVRLSRDGLLYVCDRINNRIQVFRKDGAFVKEFVVAADTRGNGSTWDAALSIDAPQTFLHTADGENNVVWTLLRDSGRLLGSFGRNGRNAGQFHWIHNLAVDSKGNLYTTEVDTSKRAQKFVNRGVTR